MRKKGPGKWHDLLGTDEERAAAGLAKGLPAMDGPRIEYNYAMGQARLTEAGVTITEDALLVAEADEKDRHGGYYIDTYRGWKIYTLQSYDTPYYYATAQRNPKTGRRVFGPSDNYPGIRRLKNRTDKHWKALGKKTLDEAEPAWGNT